MMEELREAWHHVVNSTAAAATEIKPVVSGVNIAG